MWPMLIFTFVIFAAPITAETVIEKKHAAQAEACKRDSKTLADQQECKRIAAQKFTTQRGDLAYPEPYIPIVNPADYLPPAR